MAGFLGSGHIWSEIKSDVRGVATPLTSHLLRAQKLIA